MALNVLWLQSGGCGGCSMSLLCAGRKASSAVPWQGGQLLPATQGGGHAAAALGGEVVANPVYWRCLPREAQAVFGKVSIGGR